MSSRELGLLLAQQLLDVEDLHYGLWDADLPVSLSSLAAAQQRYSDRLLDLIEQLTAGIRGARVHPEPAGARTSPQTGCR
jgi:hypothetical protein